MIRRLILGFAIFAALFFLLEIALHPWVALGLLFLSHLLLLYPTLVANCQWWGRVVTHFETSRPEVWLTIDDGPDSVHTPQMLALLREFEAKATFFVIGKRAAQFPELLKEIRQAGHEVANHTATHPSASFWAFTPRQIADEIDQAGLPASSFRAPAGLKNFWVHPALARRNLELIGWSIRGLDTVSRDPEKVAARILRGIKPGAIIVLHEGHRIARGPDFHPDCLRATLRGLTNLGYRCVLPTPAQWRPRAAQKQISDC
jgi:peptidoglycan/xylan/chitin deacetylase (PgdA/CDA1 family)